MRVIIEEQTVHDIPVLEVYNPDAPGKSPVIMILHGFTGSKESNLIDAYRFVTNGYYVLSFDAAKHGALMDEEIRNQNKIQRGRIFWKIVSETTGFIDRLLDHYQDHPLADASRVGLLGRSMGGMIVYNYIAGDRNPGVKAAVPIVATPDWVSVEREYYRTNKEAMKYYNEAESRNLPQIQPLARVAKVRDFPLLMLNGVQDPEIPIVEVRKSLAILWDDYHDHDLIQLVEYQGVGHQETPEMIHRALEWFGRFL